MVSFYFLQKCHPGSDCVFRFCDDLATFDDLDITESSLQILDPYLAKPHFDHVYMNNRTENSALVMLVKWVSGVAK